uniref:Uncharacterized protein n=1 Tax=Physcomitrium patens TaxID=3218 RepID=A0A7I4AZ37_PHYPA
IAHNKANFTPLTIHILQPSTSPTTSSQTHQPQHASNPCPPQQSRPPPTPTPQPLCTTASHTYVTVVRDFTAIGTLHVASLPCNSTAPTFRPYGPSVATVYPCSTFWLPSRFNDSFFSPASALALRLLNPSPSMCPPSPSRPLPTPRSLLKSHPPRSAPSPPKSALCLQSPHAPSNLLRSSHSSVLIRNTPITVTTSPPPDPPSCISAPVRHHSTPDTTPYHYHFTTLRAYPQCTQTAPRSHHTTPPILAHSHTASSPTAATSHLRASSSRIFASNSLLGGYCGKLDGSYARGFVVKNCTTTPHTPYVNPPTPLKQPITSSIHPTPPHTTVLSNRIKSSPRPLPHLAAQCLTGVAPIRRFDFFQYSSDGEPHNLKILCSCSTCHHTPMPQPTPLQHAPHIPHTPPPSLTTHSPRLPALPPTRPLATHSPHRSPLCTPMQRPRLLHSHTPTTTSPHNTLLRTYRHLMHRSIFIYPPKPPPPDYAAYRPSTVSVNAATKHFPTSVRPGMMGFPASSSASMHPVLQRSTATPYSVAPSSSSGGRYHNVTTRLVRGCF